MSKTNLALSFTREHGISWEVLIVTKPLENFCDFGEVLEINKEQACDRSAGM